MEFGMLVIGLWLDVVLIDDTETCLKCFFFGHPNTLKLFKLFSYFVLR